MAEPYSGGGHAKLWRRSNRPLRFCKSPALPPSARRPATATPPSPACGGRVGESEQDGRAPGGRAPPIGANIRAAAEPSLPLPACHQGVYARLRRAMERSEFALSSRKFRVRGPLRESELGQGPFACQRLRPCGGASSPRPSPRKRGEGAEGHKAALKLAPMGL